MIRRETFHVVLFEPSVAYGLERTARTAENKFSCFLRMKFFDVLFVRRGLYRSVGTPSAFVGLLTSVLR